MKYYFLLLLLPVIALTSCSKPPQFSASKQAAIDDANIRAYIANHNIVAKDTLGVYYQIITPGTGPHPITKPEPRAVERSETAKAAQLRSAAVAAGGGVRVGVGGASIGRDGATAGDSALPSPV